MRSILHGHTISIPFYTWPLAVLAGLVVAAGSLSYAPYGRINILWVWLIWAGLPALGTLMSLLLTPLASRQPWLFRWGRGRPHWFPTPVQRLHMIWLVQVVWCLVALGMLIGYLLLLLFSDLAFGWSSTLLQDNDFVARAVRWLALPWQWLWPSAVPTESLVAATQYQRIVPGEGDPAMAGQWWRFLMASLLFYNLLPRVVLAVIFYGRWRWFTRSELTVRGSPSASINAHKVEPLREESAVHWQSAIRVQWEYSGSDDAISFGKSSWSDDEATMTRLSEQQPARLLWQVEAERSPVAELGDLISLARASGVTEQAVSVRSGAKTDPARHLASWRSFALQHQLVWISDSTDTDTTQNI